MGEKPSCKTDYSFMGLPSIMLISICERRNPWLLSRSSMAKAPGPQTASPPHVHVKKYRSHRPLP